MTHVASPIPHHRVLHTVTARVGDVVLIVATLSAISLTVGILAFQWQFSYLLSNSMQPTFSAGDVLVAAPKTTKDLEVGDVPILPTPDDPNQKYVHRIVTVTETGPVIVRTQGDRNNDPDPWRLRVLSQETPVVVAHVPYLGWLGNYMSTPALRFAIATAGIVLALLVIVRTVKHPRKEHP